MDIRGNIDSFAWTSASYIKSEIKAVCLSFHGLGNTQLKNRAEVSELELASHGILTVFPYYGPWSWMNDEAIAFVDDIVEIVYDKYGLRESVPLLSTGGSMGGLSALIYTCYAQRTPNACYAL